MSSGYTLEERAAILDGMQRISNGFYQQAFVLGFHPFIEFCGLMNEYIKLCQAAHSQGIDFVESSGHSGKPLPMAPYEAAYLGEKLGCIYGPSLETPENARAFLETIGLGT